MYKAKKPLNIMNNFSFGKYQFQILSLIGFMILSLVSISSHALTPNNGSATTCPAGSTKGILSNPSYETLITSARNGSYESVNSGTSPAIPLKIRMSITDFNVSDSGSTTASGTTTYNAIDIRRKFVDQTSSTEVTLDFQNSLNNEDLFLSKVAMSAFDIDKSFDTANYWDDKVEITGVTQSGATINGSFQNINGSNVISSNGLRLPANPISANCTTTLENTCQGSVVFSDPVKSVTVRYTNTGENTTRTPTSQVLQFRLDSYCYLPVASYSITKDDNKSSISVNGSTDYTVKITNTGQSSISGITLKDPAVTGLLKQSGISCDSSDATTTCNANLLPSIAQLEGSGFPVPTLAVGKSYSIIIPTVVTAASNSNVTNTATISHATIATKSASDTNSVTLSSSSNTTAAATCPANHKMYYIGGPTTPTYSPMATPKTLTWASGKFEDKFTFVESSGNKVFNFRFTGVDLSVNEGRSSPFFGGVDNATANAINFVHSSPSAKSNNSVNLSVNRPVSRIGYKIQDLDSFGTGPTLSYIEQAIALNSGKLTFFPTFHTILQNSSSTTVTAKEGINCGLNGCTIDATWDYAPANTEVSLIHRNSKTFTNTDHAVGYSDFYFCLAPPKVVVKKVLTGNRVNDTDQFNIKVSGGSLTPDAAGSPASFTTGGSGRTISNATSSVLTLAPTTSYTIAERVLTGTNEGSINNYKASYECTNATTDSKTIMPKGDGYSFSLSNLDYGDEITCTITNTPSVYTFTGFVFNDNGGIARSTNPDTKSDISTTFTGNSKYFNGIFDNGETGIGNTTGLTISLTNCNGVNIGSTTSQTTSDNPLGQYKFTVPVNVIAALSPQKVCIVQAEPDPWVFSVDTTPNIRNIDLQAGKLDYKTEGSLNLDFGEVEGDYAALVLRKAQYVNDCRSTLNYTATNINTAGNADPIAGFSESGISGNDLTPGQCIAYRITATNRANLTINNFVMRDVLQKKGENNALVTSVLIGVSNASDYANDNVPIGENGTVKTTEFVLNPKTSRSFYFNTKYGTTMDTQ
ncbi:DUF11 domain-containing protein [Psychrobacter sp. Pi2-1]|uniref:DUF11 domain-containing protein n=1 Tax=Psychrobacter sp. Pi2-1 TaxID=2774131 RepID=UPI0019184CD2|nr:DUF11 domain-containing protein [Psychrobacter sp. Pi2-1]